MHSDKLIGNATTCLADFCDVLRCDDEDDVDHHSGICNEDEAQRRQFRCRGLFSRCFPHTQDTEELHQIFMHHFCDQLACKNFGKKIGARRFHPTQEEVMSSSGVALMIFLVAGLVIYYGIMAFLKLETATKRDLRPSRRRQPMNTLWNKWTWSGKNAKRA